MPMCPLLRPLARIVLEASLAPQSTSFTVKFTWFRYENTPKAS
jgi:hypothetical protein